MTKVEKRYLQIVREFIRSRGWRGLKGLNRVKYKGLIPGRWIYDQRTKHRRGILTPEMTKALEALPGWTWGSHGRDTEFRLQTLTRYLRKHDGSELRQTTVYRGVAIGFWLNSIRTRYKKGTLPPDLIRRMEAISGWRWRPIADRHNMMAALVREFVERYGWEKFSTNKSYKGETIGNWVERRRYDYGKKRLTKPLIQLAESIPGWRWPNLAK